MLELLRHALIWGSVLSLYLGIAFVGLLFVNAEMWLADYPPDIRKAFGPMGPGARAQRAWLGIPVVLMALAIVVYATVRFVETYPESSDFAGVALHTFVMLMVFNIVDLLVIDWLVFVRIRPAFVVLPGTEGLAGYDSYGFHARAFFKGTLGIAVASLVIAGIAVVVA